VCPIQISEHRHSVSVSISLTDGVAKASKHDAPTTFARRGSTRWPFEPKNGTSSLPQICVPRMPVSLVDGARRSRVAVSQFWPGTQSHKAHSAVLAGPGSHAHAILRQVHAGAQARQCEVQKRGRVLHSWMRAEPRCCQNTTNFSLAPGRPTTDEQRVTHTVYGTGGWSADTCTVLRASLINQESGAAR
jgi:hypothetical protein